MMQYAEELRAHRQPMVLHADENKRVGCLYRISRNHPLICSRPSVVRSRKSSGNTGVWVLAPNGTFAGTTLMADVQVQAPPQRNNTLLNFEPKRNGLASFEVKCLNVMARDVLLKINVSHWIQPLPTSTPSSTQGH